MVSQLSTSFDQIANKEAFIITMMVHFALTFVIGWVSVRIPFFKWVPLILFGRLLLKYPTAPIQWDSTSCYLFWGLVTAYVMYFRKRMSYSGSFQLAFPSLPRFHTGGFFTKCGRVIRFFFVYLWKAICELTYRVFIWLPVVLIRLGYWLKHTIPKLRTWSGWWMLTKGILSWFYGLLPFEIRAEFARWRHGKDAATYMGEELGKKYKKEREKQRQREQNELKRAFRKIAKAIKNMAKRGIDPNEAFQGTGTQEERQSQSTQQNKQKKANNQDDDFWSKQKQQTESDRQSRGTQNSSTSANSSSSSHQQSSQKKDTSSSQSKSNWWEQGKETAESGAKEPKQNTSRGEPHPMSKAFYDLYKEDFLAAGWVYDATEERYGKKRDSYAVLGLSSTATAAEVKKAWVKLSQQYTKFANSGMPMMVQERAHEILSEINGAKDKLIRAHKFKKKDRK